MVGTHVLKERTPPASPLKVPAHNKHLANEAQDILKP